MGIMGHYHELSGDMRDTNRLLWFKFMDPTLFLDESRGPQGPNMKSAKIPKSTLWKFVT